MFSEPFLMDAVRLATIHLVSPSLLFSYVVSMPMKSSPESTDEYALLISEPVVLQVELGQIGERHRARLFQVLRQSAFAGLYPDHLRTDGDSVWAPTSVSTH